MSNNKIQPHLISAEESQELNVEMMEINKKVNSKNILEFLNGYNETISNRYSIFEFNLINSLDLSNRSLTDLPLELSGLSNLTYLNLSNNEFIEIPYCLLVGMESIEILDLSKNRIKHITIPPACVAKLKVLKLQSNQIDQLPEWICSHSIREIYLGGNGFLFSNEVHSANNTQDKSNNTANIHFSFSKLSSSLEVINFGLNECYQNDNSVEVFPFHDILECTDLKHLNLENVHLSDINSQICQFQNLITINFSNNVLMWLPDAFCNLINLEECFLSYNNIVFLPKDIGNLHCLKKLHLNNNNLESLPASIKLLSLEELDLYSNFLTTMPDIVNHVDAVDVAQNSFDEPHDELYIRRKQNIRQKYNMFCRHNEGNEDKYCDGYLSLSESEDIPEDDDRLFDCIGNAYDEDENWDTDDYWEPSVILKRCPSNSSSTHPNKQESPGSPLKSEYFQNNVESMDGQFDDN